MEKYRVRHDNEIHKIKIDSETAKFVTVGRNRSMKMNSYACYFNTFEEAIAFIIRKLKEDIKEKTDQIFYTEKKILENQKKIQEVRKIKESDIKHDN